MPLNRAAWLTSPKNPQFQIKPSIYPKVSSHDILICVHAWAINPIDQMLQAQGSKLSYPWLKNPFILGLDVAGEVLEVGSGVTRFHTGDRVLGLAYGLEKVETDKSASREFPRAGFQEYVLLAEYMSTAMPDGISYEQACVLPLGLSTAACGLFQPDQLNLRRPSKDSSKTGETVLIWGGSSSVGMNAIQLAVASGYEVFTTCSLANFETVRRLGASQVWDYKSSTVVRDIITAFEGRLCAGAFTSGAGAADKAFDILHQVPFPKGRKRNIAMATYPMPDPVPTSLILPKTVVHFVSWLVGAWWKGVTRGIGYKFIWGGSLIDDGLGEEIFAGFLEDALEEGRYLCYPEPRVVGKGVESLQGAVNMLAKGVSATKLVVVKM